MIGRLAARIDAVGRVCKALDRLVESAKARTATAEEAIQWLEALADREATG